MGQMTIHLDTETERVMKAQAKAAGISPSRWLVGLIREKVGQQWPSSVVKLAGAWKDLPETEEIRAAMGEDVARESI